MVVRILVLKGSLLVPHNFLLFYHKLKKNSEYDEKSTKKLDFYHQISYDYTNY